MEVVVLANLSLSREEKNALKYRLTRANLVAIKEGSYLDEELAAASKAKWKLYSLSGPLGKILYDDFTDEELLKVLKDSATLLNHSPSQKEINWVLKDYIKLRFGKWPYALKQAGLAKGAGSGGMTYQKIMSKKAEKEQVLKELRDVSLEMGHIPHPRQVPELKKEIKKFYSSWGEALRAAGIDPLSLTDKSVYKIYDLEDVYIELLEEVRETAFELGRAPMHTEIVDEIKKPLLKRCGSWRNVLFQIDLEPVVRRKPFEKAFLDYRKEGNRKHHSNSLHDCYFKILNPSDEIESYLRYIRKTYDDTGVILDKAEIDSDMRKALISRCSSWANVLFQVDLADK